MLALNMPKKLGSVKIEEENISEIYEKACPILSALKNIQAITVKAKVKTIENSSLRLGNNLPLATVSRFFDFFL